MAPKKNKKNASKKAKKATPKKSIKKTAAKKTTKKAAPKKATTKKASPRKAAAKRAAPETGTSRGIPPVPLPCICIQNEDGWFCMKRLPSGELKECDGPFDTREECESHNCR